MAGRAAGQAAGKPSASQTAICDSLVLLIKQVELTFFLKKFSDINISE